MTLEQVKELASRVDYDPVSGEMVWKEVSKFHEYTKGRRCWKVEEGETKPRAMVAIEGNKYRISSARLAWFMHYQELPDSNVYRKDGDPTNHKIDNLYLSEKAESTKCKFKHCKKTGKVMTSSGQVGVSWDRARKKWLASIRKDYKQIFLGRYGVFEDAVEARLDAEERYFS